MKKSMKVIIMTVLAVAMVLSCAACDQDKKTENTMLKEVCYHVLDAGIYTTLDYDYASQEFANGHDLSSGMCTAVAKVTEDGTMLMGRNMDLTISNKAAYVVRTAVEGCYETVGLTYTPGSQAPDYEEARDKGITEEFRKQIPFLSCDVLNSEGLYIETNMREGECWPSGEDKFTCSGTNPDSDTRVYMVLLPRYIGEHCATVDEALEYVKTLNIFTMEGGIDAWNFCFMLADATGHYGLMEFAQNKIIWHEGQQAQTNFYIDKDMAAIEEYKCGIGRYETVIKGIDSVQSKEDMLALMNKVTYHQMYSPETCQYDPRSEFIATYPHWTYDYVMAKENQEEVMSVMKSISECVSAMTRQEKQDKNSMWESIFTEIADCNEKTLFVRFFEDDTRTITLTFEN